MKRALICGISGQDGSYLAKLLREKNYEVFGTSRDAEISKFSNLKNLGIWDEIKCHSMTLTDFRSVLQILSDVQPDEIYNLAGQSSVGLSFDQPVETLESIAFGTLNLLEAMRFIGSNARLYNASSGECYGERQADKPAIETSPFYPRSPYGVAKAAGYWMVSNYREAYGLYACSGLLFNHESPLRPERFVTQKIVRVRAVSRLDQMKNSPSGNLDVIRDWGYAPEYVEAMWLMLQRDEAEDFIIATGKSHSLKYFTEKVFHVCGLNWTDLVRQDDGFFRVSDIAQNYADPTKARKKLGWKAQTDIDQLIGLLIESERARLTHG